MSFNNSGAIGFFKLLSARYAGPDATKLDPRKDMCATDANFISSYLTFGCAMCDLGSGSGKTINLLANQQRGHYSP